MSTGNNIYRHYLLLTAALLLLSTGFSRADVTVDQLMGKDKEMFDKFRYLFQNGDPEEFFSYADDYEQILYDKCYMMLYYGIQGHADS